MNIKIERVHTKAKKIVFQMKICFLAITLVLTTSLLAEEISNDYPVNTWLGKTPAWQNSSNWSIGKVPSPEKFENIIIPLIQNNTFPVLAEDTVIGGTLIIRKGACLKLNGYNLNIGRKIPGTYKEAALIIQSGGELYVGQGSPSVIINAGGLDNQGTIRGKPKLQIMGKFAKIVINAGSGIELDECTTAYSPYPYPIEVEGSVTINGSLILSGGKLIIKSLEFIVKGDLIYRGKTPCVIIVPENNLILHGTIKSEGSAFCMAIPGSISSWNQKEETAQYSISEKIGWIRMVGSGNQEIKTGGVLPPIAIDKESGKVTLDGDLHCTGLYIEKGNTLDLSKGHIIFDHYLREWVKNPELNARPAYLTSRTCRDLINKGEIIGTPNVSVNFLLTIDGIDYKLETSHIPAPYSGTKGEALHSQIDNVLPEQAPNSLAVNRLKSRIQIRNGKMYLDDKLCGLKYSKTNKELENTVVDDELDNLMGDLEDFSDKPEGKTTEKRRKASIMSLKLQKIDKEAFVPPEEWSYNIAPYVKQIDISGRSSITWAVNGAIWKWNNIYDIVDGSSESSFGGSEYYNFIFPEQVTVAAIKMQSSSSVVKAFQLLVSADTSGDGKYDKILAWKCDGQPNEKSWLSWGTNSAIFPPCKIFSLRLQAFSSDSKLARIELSEFEIYGNKKSYDQLIKNNNRDTQQAKIPANSNFLSYGKDITAKWPAPDEDNRVTKVVTVALWMFGVGWSENTTQEYWEKLPNLKEYPQCITVLKDIKNKYKYDAVKVFFEGEQTGFAWPSINFKSAPNASYLSKRKIALQVGKALKSDKKDELDELIDDFDELIDDEADDELLDTTKVNDPSKAYSETLKLEDLPCQRNLLKEYCEAAHEQGLSVQVVCRPEDISNLYVGPKGKDSYAVFLRECVVGGVDGVSLVPDEENMLWSASRHPDWQTFYEQNVKRKDFTPVELKQWMNARNKMAGNIIKERKESIQKERPDCMFFTDGARLLSGGDPYDVIGHAVEPDFMGCHYQPHIVRRWLATSKKRKVYIGDYVGRTVRQSLEAMLQGAKLIGSYRYNYIEIAGSEDYRIRENIFIDNFVKWGGTRPSRAPIAFLVSRASEAWWPMDCKNGSSESKQSSRAWAVSEIAYNFLMKNGYTFDVYYLDQVDDLNVLENYPLIILPFPYSIPKMALPKLNKAFDSGSNFLVFERKGEVDENGKKYKQALLTEFLKKGEKDGRINFISEDLLSLETKRSFIPAMTSTVDKLLGKHKDLELKRYGNKIEAILSEISPEEKYLSIINWENKTADIEVGLNNLPQGEYKILTLSSDKPKEFREGLIAGKKNFTAGELKKIYIKLNPDEVLSLYIIQARPYPKRVGR